MAVPTATPTRADVRRDRERRGEHLQDPLLHQVDDPRGRGRRQQREQDDELVAADPEHGVARAHDADEPLRRQLQEGVAGGVAVGVVHALEPVQIAVEQAEHVVGAAPAELLAEAGEEGRPVGKARELVVARVVQRPLLAQAHVGDVGEDDDARELAVEAGLAALGGVPAAGAAAVDALDLELAGRLCGQPGRREGDRLRGDVVLGPQADAPPPASSRTARRTPG